MKKNLNAVNKSSIIKLCLVVLSVLLLPGQNNFWLGEAAPALSRLGGTMMAFAGPIDASYEAQQGWMLCDGRSLYRAGTRYRDLVRTVGTTLGGDTNLISPKSFQKRSASGAPSPAELKKVDDLLHQHNYAEAVRELARLQKKYKASSEVYYRSIKALALEVKWATTLQGQDRVQVMRRLMYSEDYLGLMCASSKAYLELFGSSDKHFKTVRALHNIAKTSLDGARCKQRPTREFVTEEFVSRLEPFANFIKKLEALTFE